jgi:hypothetical protein
MVLGPRRFGVAARRLPIVQNERRSFRMKVAKAAWGTSPRSFWRVTCRGFIHAQPGTPAIQKRLGDVEPATSAEAG